MHVSIILCTRDRADSLRETLRSFNALEVPPEWQVELLIMDDGSHDHTGEVARAARLDRVRVRYFAEPRVGKCPALNHALAEATGEALLFTDDDVRVPRNWLTAMAGPLLADETDAIGGPVRLDPALRRDWMDATLDVWLAAGTPPPGDLWGVNMAIHRRVLERVPGFDCRLGPGALGYAEDTLFAMLIERAGFRMSIGTAVVAHYPDASRLNEESLLRAARGRGVCTAYFAHHVQARRVRAPRLRMALYRWRRALRLVLSRPGERPRVWLLFYTWHIHFLEEMIALSGSPRRYHDHAAELGWAPGFAAPNPV